MKYVEEDRVLECYRRYKDTVYKLAYSYCKCKSQAEDAFQEVFYKFMARCPGFQDSEHEKAWFIRTTINVCKDILKTKWNCDMVGLEEWDSEDGFAVDAGDILDELRDAILALPERYRVPVHLYYYEEYSVQEIVQMLHRTESAVQTQLQRGREKIRQTMEGSGAPEHAAWAEVEAAGSGYSSSNSDSGNKFEWYLLCPDREKCPGNVSYYVSGWRYE